MCPLNRFSLALALEKSLFVFAHTFESLGVMGNANENHHKKYSCDCRGSQKLALISGPGLGRLKLDARSHLLYIAPEFGVLEFGFGVGG